MKKIIQQFENHREAEILQKKTYRAMSHTKRLETLHEINKRIYGKNVYAKRLQRVLEVIEPVRR